MPNSAQLRSSCWTWKAACWSRMGSERSCVGVEWSAVATVCVGRRTVEAALAEALERLRAGDLVDEVEVDAEDGRGAGLVEDDVVVPDLLDERAGTRGVIDHRRRKRSRGPGRELPGELDGSASLDEERQVLPPVVEGVIVGVLARGEAERVARAKDQ